MNSDMNSDMNSELQKALRLIRMLLDMGYTLDEALQNPAVGERVRERARTKIEAEQNVVLTDPRILVSRTRQHSEWLKEEDRSQWYYWPRLRTFLIDSRGWKQDMVRSLDNATDRILAQLEHPSKEQFDTRGLILGYVQSGKTANYTALIAKAVDVGYRLIIVLSGVHNTLRRQTQIRLNKELVGYVNGRADSIELPPQGRRWFTFTTDDLFGDFNPGTANYAALQGTQPVLIVAKKNKSVLERLQEWLDSAPEDVRRTLPVLIIDDEADQATVNTGGNRSEIDEEDDGVDDTPPSTINQMVRLLVRRFSRSAYIGYTATPFANMLIPHTAEDKQVGPDLYPKDFIVDLPKPEGYFGPEEIFGRSDGATEQERDGIDVIHEIPEDDLEVLIPPRGTDPELFEPEMPESLENAISDFILAGAARRARGAGREPAAMLIHTHLRTIIQQRLTALVQRRLSELKDEWRYQREFGIRTRLEARWTSEFRPLTRSLYSERDMPFDAIEEQHIGPFLEAIEVRQINSASEEVLDYERDPSLKAIVIGGNRLSRGLTLEGLLISYYVRSSNMYDTLLQMGRWFGFREGYEDLTRIFTTADLARAFSDLATVEYQLRADIRVYESAGVTPLELGPRILRHPAMLVTSRLKSRWASEVPVAEQSYAGQLLQTTIFPFQDLEFLEANIELTRGLISSLKTPTEELNTSVPIWKDVPAARIIDFLKHYRVDLEAQRGPFPIDLIIAFIARQTSEGALVNWTVAVEGRATRAEYLGYIDLGRTDDQCVNLIERNRLRKRPNSVGVLTGSGDEEIDLTEEQLATAEERIRTENLSRDQAVRLSRPSTNALLLIYPVGRNSGHGAKGTRMSRLPLYENPETGLDVIGVAISFPDWEGAQSVRGRFADGEQGTYVVGTVGWQAEYED